MVMSIDDSRICLIRTAFSSLHVPSPPLQLVVTKQRDKTEVFFSRMLKEDKGAGQWEGSSYIDFLCQVHRDIKEILS